MVEDIKEKDDELAYLRAQSGSAEREEQLLARLEEEEAKVALLEKHVRESSRSQDLSRSLESLKGQLSREISRREELENREIDLVREKEEAIDRLEEVKMSMREQEAKLSELESARR